MKSDLIDLDVTLHHQTEKAWLVSSVVSTPTRVWVPKSQAEIEGGADPEKKAILTLSESLAIEKGLV